MSDLPTSDLPSHKGSTEPQSVFLRLGLKSLTNTEVVSELWLMCDEEVLCLAFGVSENDFQKIATNSLSNRQPNCLVSEGRASERPALHMRANGPICVLVFTTISNVFAP